ncbi:hypothetical protein J5N97_017076 [Dioscorea zingiberensis]|uniref:Uncharacterized protein n=1 Tax=Dioscorea zingiberensis TaxID=325984 RepID=A0A9D5CKI8_9LILI|nr:hypothetical protein J5N97_017076 [Dioscorea zingiberensis]
MVRGGVLILVLFINGLDNHFGTGEVVLMDILSPVNLGLIATITYVYVDMVNKIAALMMAENTNVDGMNPIETRGKRQAKQGSRHVWNSEQDALLVECLTRLAQSGKWKADNDRATGEGAEAPADAVEEIANEEAAATTDSYIGDDFWDIELEDDINVANEEDNPSVIPSPTNGTATSLPGTSQAGPSRKVKRKRSLGQDVGPDEISSNINTIGSWIESSGEHVARLASCFQFLSDDADAKRKVFGELLKLEGLTKSERIKVGGILVQDTSKVAYFFSLPDDCKEEYVRGLF